MTFPVGKDLEELKNKILEAVNLSLEDQSRKVTMKEIKLTMDLPQFFEYYKVINAKALSERIGMNQSLLAQYIKGNKKPTLTQTKKILRGVQKIGRELSEVSFFL